MKQYTNWLQLIQEYGTQTGRAIDDEIKIATIINHVKGPLRNHLLLNMDDVTTFNDVKKKITDHFQSTYDVSHQHQGRHNHQGPAICIRAKGRGDYHKGSLKSRSVIQMDCAYIRGNVDGSGRTYLVRVNPRHVQCSHCELKGSRSLCSG
eukprot:902328-Amphidinium_carterae.1